MPAQSQKGSWCVWGGEAQGVPGVCVSGVCSGALASWSQGPGSVACVGAAQSPGVCPVPPSRDSQPRAHNGLQVPSSRWGSECGLSPAAHSWWGERSLPAGAECVDPRGPGPGLGPWDSAQKVAIPTAGCSPLSLRIRGHRFQFERLGAAPWVRVRETTGAALRRPQESVMRAGDAEHRL